MRLQRQSRWSAWPESCLASRATNRALLLLRLFSLQAPHWLGSSGQGHWIRNIPCNLSVASIHSPALPLTAGNWVISRMSGRPSAGECFRGQRGKGNLAICLWINCFTFKPQVSLLENKNILSNEGHWEGYVRVIQVQCWGVLAHHGCHYDYKGSLLFSTEADVFISLSNRSP